MEERLKNYFLADFLLKEQLALIAPLAFYAMPVFNM